MTHPEYIDIHTHINFGAFDEDRDDVIQRAHDAGVAMVNVGTNYKTSKQAVELAQDNTNMFAVVGLHPVHTTQRFHDEKEMGKGGDEFVSHEEKFDAGLFAQFATHKKVVGIGETGLDHYHGDGADAELTQRQQDAFEKQITFAAEHRLPLMIHCRDAYDDLLDILEAHKPTYGDHLFGNAHFFVGTRDVARRFLELNFTLSFTGVVTITHEYDDVVKYVPKDMIHAETDAPFVAPKPNRGKRNEPSYLPYIVQQIAEVRGESEEDLKPILIDNAKRVFGVDL